jgi:hypothetical protein
MQQGVFALPNLPIPGCQIHLIKKQKEKRRLKQPVPETEWLLFPKTWLSGPEKRGI